jgi:hypothetical protein
MMSEKRATQSDVKGAPASHNGGETNIAGALFEHPQ